MKYIKHILAGFALFFIMGTLVAVAAPGATIFRNILPESTGVYDLGASTSTWKEGYFTTLHGDGSLLTGISGSFTSTTINGLNSTTSFIIASSSGISVTHDGIRIITINNLAPNYNTTTSLNGLTGAIIGLNLYNTTTSLNGLTGAITGLNLFNTTTTPGGSNTQIQFNNAGSFAGDSGLTWTSSTKRFTLGGASTFDTEIVNVSSTLFTDFIDTYAGAVIEISSPAFFNGGISRIDSDTLSFNMLSNTVSSTLNFKNITASTTFTFPNASGTLALTSGVVSSLNGLTGDINSVDIFGQNLSSTGTPIFASSSITNLLFTTATGTTLNFNDATKLTTGSRGISFNVSNATTSASATTTIQKLFYNAITITQIDCSTNGANATIGADERASSTPDTSGTDVFNNGSMVCDSNGNTTSTFANATMAANAVLNFDLDTLANSTTTVRVYIRYREQ